MILTHMTSLSVRYRCYQTYHQTQVTKGNKRPKGNDADKVTSGQEHEEDDDEKEEKGEGEGKEKRRRRRGGENEEEEEEEKKKKKKRGYCIAAVAADRNDTLHWEYPWYGIIASLYIPILSGAVLIFTGLRIRSTLHRRRTVQIKLYQANAHRRVNDDVSQLATTAGNRRTLKVLTFTGLAFFVFWFPYSTSTLARCVFSPFMPPSAVAFAAMWLANSNSAVNVFIYSSTNRQFRRQCVLLASRLCCSR